MSFPNSIRSVAVATAVALAPGAALAVHDNIIPEPIPTGDIEIGLEVVAEGGDLNAPVWATYAPGVRDTLFIADQDGQLFALNLKSGEMKTVLDVSGLIVPLGAIPGVLNFDERGFIGLAFHPDYRYNRKFYTVTSEPSDGDADFSTMPPGTTANHQMVLREWRAKRHERSRRSKRSRRSERSRRDGAIDPGSSKVLLRIDEPQFNHNSGAIVFDKTGKLLMAVGDGGGADDQPDIDRQPFLGPEDIIVGHGAVGNGQNPSNILGSILRIDVDGDNAANGKYGIPSDNPFAFFGGHGGQAGCQDGACDEIYAYGFRNAYRISVDMGGDRLIFASDVGQNDVEEVDVVVAAGNYGWNVKEGTWLFEHNGNDDVNGLAFASTDSPGSPPNMIDPVAQYDHDEGVAVLGGFVYRGYGVKALHGRYVFAEFAKPPFNPFAPNCDGRVFHLNNQIGDADLDAITANNFDGQIREFPGNVAAGNCLLGLGQDAKGEIYVLGNNTGIPIPPPEGGDAPIGVVMKIVKP